MSEDDNQDPVNTESQSPHISGAEEQVENPVVNEQAVKSTGSGAILKLLALLAIVYGLIQYGLPMMNGVVAEFKKKQAEQDESVSVESGNDADEGALSSAENDAAISPMSTPLVTEPSDDEILKQAFEEGISEWLSMKSSDETAKVKFINANEAGDRLAVEYVKVVHGDELMPSKELIFTKDEFGIFIYKDAAGIRQIRVRQPK